MNAPNRRGFLHGAAGLALGSLFGCGGRTAAGAPRELRMFVYAGGHETTLREVFVPLFEAATGARVVLIPGWWDGIPKLKAAPADDPPFDLMITDATQGYPAAKEGLFAEIDLDRVPNRTALADAALDVWVYRDRVGLPYPDSVMTFAFRRTQDREAPARWSDLLDPARSGRVGLYNHFYMSLFTFAAILADVEQKSGTAHELIRTRLDDVFRFAAAHRARVALWWPTSTDMILALHDGTVDSGNMHSPEYLQALREKPVLGAVVPEKDRALVQVFWAIPAGTPNRDLAHAALDMLFSFDVQSGFVQRGMATPRLDVAVRTAAEDPLWASLYPHTPEQFRDLRYYPYDVYAGAWDELADRWDRTVLRAG